MLQKLAFSFLLMAGLLVQQNSFAQYNDYNNGYNDDRDRDVSYQNFYDELSPYGRWVDYPGQGYVWVPDAEEDFQPYSTNGHWVWSEDYEWMWVSDYDWGWAPFHYGRWDRDDYYGWYWVPGYEWAPAWVAWRDGGDYYGWAPLRPGISFNINIGSYNPPQRFWCFTPRRYINSQRWYDYRVDWRQNVSIINYTTIINYNTYSNNYGFRSGPRRYDAERYCGRINPVRFRETFTPGRTTYRNNEVNVYRPRVVRQNDNANGRIAPQHFERYDRNNGRSEGGFRGQANNGRVNNDNGRRPNDADRINNDRGVRRNDDNNGRNNQPQGQGNNNRGFNRQRSETNNPGNRPGDGRVIRPDERNDRQPADVNNNDRRFERPDNNNGNGRRTEQPQRPPQTERRNEPAPQQPARQFERRNEGNNNSGGRTFDQPQRQQPPPQRVERRDDANNGSGQRGRNFEQPQPQQQPQRAERSNDAPQQQPARQIERRNDNGGGGNGNNSGQSNRGEGRTSRRF
jgi:hypothetical protein